MTCRLSICLKISCVVPLLLAVGLAGCEDAAAPSTAVAKDASGDSGSVTPDSVSDAALDGAVDATIDAPADATPDVTPDTAPDVTPDAAPDVTPDAAPDVTPDVTADVATDATTDAAPTACADGTFLPMDATACVPATCDALSAAANDAINGAVAKALSCQKASDCVLVATSTTCQGACGVAVNVAGATTVADVVAWVDANLCKPYDYASKCGYSTPKCMAPNPACVQGQCAYAP